MDRWIRTTDDVLTMLDQLLTPGEGLARGTAEWWDQFYVDRSRAVPFFAAKPDENLVSYLEEGLLVPGRALDLGCGPGRNAIWLARAGFTVDAIDLSPAAIAWATERAGEADAEVSFHCGSIFSAAPPGPYDLIYDSGCLHHLAPHRRISYLALLNRILRPGGYFGLACFASGAMGSELSDDQFYRDGELHGGLAFKPEELRRLFSDFTEVQVRPMMQVPADAPAFGVPFLLTALFQHPAEAGSLGLV
jgi:SAM-dependent methyltransferase